MVFSLCLVYWHFLVLTQTHPSASEANLRCAATELFLHKHRAELNFYTAKQARLSTHKLTPSLWRVHRSKKYVHHTNKLDGSRRAAVTLTFDHLTPTANQHIYGPILRLWQRVGEISLIGFWDIVFTRFSGHTDSRTHPQTDRPECSVPPAPFYNGDGRMKTLKNAE